MLSCQECERYLTVFLDHALEVKESLDVQAHLQSCFSCHDRAESERRLRLAIEIRQLTAVRRLQGFQVDARLDERMGKATLAA